MIVNVTVCVGVGMEKQLDLEVKQYRYATTTKKRNKSQLAPRMSTRLGSVLMRMFVAKVQRSVERMDWLLHAWLREMLCAVWRRVM